MLILEFGRMIVALGLVLGLLWLFSKFGRGRQVKSRARWLQGGVDASRIEVMDRRSLGRHSSIAVVRAAGRIVVVGQTPQQISVLLDADREPAVLDGEGVGGETPVIGGPSTEEDMLMPRLASTIGADTPKAWDAFLERLREMTVRH
jgi:Flagellar biosynthesis protein, FliO